MAKRISVFNRKKINDDKILLDCLLNDESSFAVREAYLKLCTNIMYIPGEKKCKTIVVTSAIPGEGKDLLSANLALTLANYAGNNKVLLIDSDLRCSEISATLSDNEIYRGLSEYLVGDDEEVYVSKNSKYGSLEVVLSGAHSSNPAALLSSKRLPEAIRRFEETYDYIIINVPPIEAVTDALLYSPIVDGYIISTKANYSNINRVSDAIDSIRDVNGKVLGVVLTSAKSNRSNCESCSYGNYKK